jgi:hypothetical protein
VSTTDEGIYRRLHDWLLDHIQRNDPRDDLSRPHIELKRTHSLKVADEIHRLGLALGLAGRPLLIARAIGLLHDVGRFEQFRRFRTYNDAASTDHGALGAAIVAEAGVLASFGADEAHIITQAIFHHNKLALPVNLSDEGLFHLKLIRDADKLDIFRVIMESMAAAEQALFKVFISNSDDVSEAIHATLMRGGNVDYNLAKNHTDRLLMHVGWVFDINFRPTLGAIADRGYLETIAATLPPTPRVTQILSKARSYLAAALADGPLYPPGQS